MTNKIQSLADPNQYQQPLNIEGYSKDFLIYQLESMLIVRGAEEILSNNIANGIIKCPCHLGIGQEAVAVGISNHLRKTDRVFGAHRSHSHFLALNRNTFSLFAEVLGKESGSSHGMGGSMHIIDKNNGFWGSVPIVGATVPIATGAALAAKMDKKGDIAVSYFGDGATEEGGVQESFNLASSMQLPVLFVCENNLFASHLHIDLRQPANATARYAEAHRIPYELIDGNDVIAVSEATQRAVEHLREGKGPFYIEMVTYRWKGHVGHRDDIDVGVQRKDDLLKWKKRDPIRRLTDAMVVKSMMSENELNIINETIKEELSDNWQKAMQADFPNTSVLLNLVYA
jgi:TPP-dependent pyruvate/acetoin dehydrogenase alpha subunit